ncbi:HET-domain-containing protein [Mytilinidion resinicola]|uniref:HET-domain-containing protein n=1 Tax=Mytilinidion resinicola TaxID=574789 RepID=A0A6A6Y558_9PEZI|nr:HET-domain-containing protein [Mytilinidion resinicola]KAF2803365.1 HET-domain-containing protein [Mytilinidion resinicola]
MAEDQSSSDASTDCVICTSKSTSLCARCRSIRYCSKECQATDWPRHKIFCKKYAEKSPRVEKPTGGSFTDMTALHPMLDQYVDYVSEERTSYPPKEVSHPWSTIRGITFSHFYPDEPKQWLKWCLESHDDCNSWTHHSDHAALPTRLVDIGNGTDQLSPRLIVTADTEMVDKRYIALSHRWPTPQDLHQMDIRTTNDSLNKKLERIEEERLSKTFKFAIGACRWLGTRYIWIDSLCIIQVCQCNDDSRLKAKFWMTRKRTGTSNLNRWLLFTATRSAR